MERLGREQEGNMSSQVDSEWCTAAPSRSGVARRLCVEYWHSAQDEMEVTEWLLDSSLSSGTPSRRGVASRLLVEFLHSA